MAKLIGKEEFVLRLAVPTFKPFEGEEEGDKGEGDKGGKGESTPKFATVEEAQQYVESLRKKNKDLLKETMDRKEKLRNYEKRDQETQEALAKEQGKYKELYEGLSPKAKRLEEVEPVLNEILDLELADIPEDKRDLVPEGPVEQKLKWVKTAKAKGLFGVPGKKVPINSEGKKPNQEGGTPEYASLKENDPRLQQLTTEQFIVWKQHNRASKQGVKGWGG